MFIKMAKVKIEGLTPYSPSKHYDVPFLDGELPEAYDIRNWREHMHVEENDKGQMTVVIPAESFHQAMISAAKYSGEKIKGQKQKTWTAKISSGSCLFANIDLGIDPELDFADFMPRSRALP